MDLAGRNVGLVTELEGAVWDQGDAFGPGHMELEDPAACPVETLAEGAVYHLKLRREAGGAGL